MRKFTFESSFGDDRVMLCLREISISDTINKFFGFLRASGYDDELIKNCTRDIIDGKWSNTLGAVIGTTHGLQISPLTISSLTTNQFSALGLTSSSYNTLKTPYENSIHS